MDDHLSDDPMLALIGRLPPIAVDPARDASIRQLCHVAIANRYGRHESRRRTTRDCAVDLILAGAAGAYLVVSLITAAQLLAG